MVAIGGVGGSGTRVIAECVESMGFYLGSDINKAKDNLWFTLLFKRKDIIRVSDLEFRELVRVFCDAMHARRMDSPLTIKMVHSLAAHAREQHSVDWLKLRAASLLGELGSATSRLIAWKEPNTHIVLDRLLHHIPALRYIHVMRNGLDMAFSPNQNQTRLWGPTLTGQPFSSDPSYSLRYWRRAHERVFAIGRAMEKRFLVVDFDKFCAGPAQGINAIARFCGVAIGEETLVTTSAKVSPPPSLGRFRRNNLAGLNPDDIEFVGSCGFPTI